MGETHRLIQNLKTIGALELDQKLYTSSDEFSISHVSSYQKFLRTYYGENRQTNLDKIRQTLHNSKNEAILIMKLSPDISWEHKCTLESLLASLESLMKGITNLMETYRDDIAYKNKLSVTLEDTSNFLTWARKVDLTKSNFKDLQS